MTLAELNSLDEVAVCETLLDCCGSLRWARGVAKHRPFAHLPELQSTANKVWWTADPQDWLEAFATHPKIGESDTKAKWSADEQRGMNQASTDIREKMLELNRAYERKFGWIFIVCASGKSAEEMQALLEQRLNNQREDELLIAAEEQTKITGLRLAKLLSA